MKINLIFLTFFGISSSFGQAPFGSDNVGDAGGELASLNITSSSLEVSKHSFLNENESYDLVPLEACVAPTITANPPNRAICAGNNTTFMCSATGATAFQWQENSGSGFTDIVNGGVFSNATTSVLTITGATAGMSGNLYRCRAIDDVCFTNTNQSMLTISSVNTSSAAQTNVSCNGFSNGAAGVTPSGGIAPYSYSWSPSGGTGSIATGLSAGSYTVTVTDNIGCQGTRNYTITQPPVLNGSTVVTNVACFGGNTGAINLTPSGGTPGYTFNWSAGPTTEDRTSLTAGTYAVTITDANGCTRNVTGITVTQPTSAVSGTTVVTNVSCNSGTNGAINLTPTGGTGPYTYTWSAGPTTEDRTGLTAGSYSVTITDANACTGIVSGITVTQPTAVSGTTVVTNTSCNGGTNGTIDLTPTGGTPGYTYSWVGGATSQDRISLGAGSYSVTITDANACTGTVSGITVTQPTAVSGSTVITNVACFGGNTGAINLTPTGGTPGYTFNWSGGVTTEDRTLLTAGTYSVTITDANGCTGTVSPTLTQSTALSLTPNSQTNVACNGGSTGAAAVNNAAGGGGSYTYNWTPGNPTGDGTTSVTGLIAQTYTCTVTDANACVASMNFTVTQPTALSLTAASQTNVACNGGSTGATAVNSATGGAGGYTYNWTPGNPTGDGTTSITGLTAQNYTCTVTDANSCVASVIFSVTQPNALSLTAASQTNVACFGTATGAAAVNNATGGAGSYTYDWTPGTPTGDGTTSITGLTAQSYTCTATDANGCTFSQLFTITQPTAVVSGTTVVTNISCNGGTNGAINLTPTGGTPGYTYNWGGGITTEDRMSLAAGTYAVTITDANGCVGTVSGITVTQPMAPISGTTVVTNISCNGGTNGVINLTPTGGIGFYTYNWGGGITTEDRTGLAAGTYSVTITDANGCVGTVSGITVTQPTAPISGTTVLSDVSCNGGSNGTIYLTPSGGTPGYTYNWGGGVTSQDRIGVVAGTYSVIITDANGCTGTVSGISITEPTAISLTASSQTNIACNGNSDGAAAVNTPTGGTGAFTYDWTPGTPSGDGTISVNGLSAGTYTCTATDNNGCIASQSFTVTQPPAISLIASSQTNVSCNGGSNGVASINTPTGGAGGFTYDWTPGTPTGDGTVSITGLTAQNYTCTVTDANGCIATQAFTVTQPPAISVTASSQTNVSCNGGSNGAVSIDTPTGGTGAFTYDWTPGTPTGDGTTSITGLTAQTYTCTVTDANGCIASQSFTVTEPSILVATIASQDDVTCNGEATGEATVLVIGGTGTYEYSWSPSGGAGATASGLVAGTYTNTITDDNGCTTTATVTITEPSVLSAVISDQVNAACNGEANGSATVTSTGGIAPYEYVWSPTGGTNETAAGLAAGTYTTTITDDNGCTTTTTVVITEPLAITATIAVTECDSATVNGMTYYTTDLYEQVLVSSVTGCDSTLTIDVTIELTPLGVASLLNDTTVQTLEVGDYQWVNCATGLDIPNATGAIFEPTNNGSYAVNITNGNCSVLSNCVTVNGFSTIGISEKEEIQFSFAPNPAHTSITLFMSATMTAQLSIMDAQGKIVITNPSVTNGTQVSLDHLERGVYFLQLQSEKGAALKRVVKQ